MERGATPLSFTMRPNFLHPGDTIGLITTARRITPDVAERAEAMLTSWGLNVRKTESLTSSEHSYHGASVETRARDLQTLLDDPQVKAVMCARGGYGSSQILDMVKWDEFKKNPKWIVGFSDVTALHLQAYRLGVESIHSLMPLQFKDEKQKPAYYRLKKILFGDVVPLSWSTGAGSRTGESTGALVGGNLSLITDALATTNELHTFGTILFLEEVDEPFYKVDKMLTHLKRAKKLDKIKGLVVGYFTDIKDTDIPYGETVEEIILSKIPTTIPVAFGCPSGHQAPNMPWIHGAQVKLHVDESGSSIEFLQASV